MAIASGVYGCVLPAQFTACAEIADGAECELGTMRGTCFDGACIPQICGDRIVDVNEVCEDGNRDPGAPGRCVLVGGTSGSGSSPVAGDWQWDGTVWTQIPLAPRRVLPLLAHAGDRFVLYGGAAGSSSLTVFRNDTWSSPAMRLLGR